MTLKITFKKGGAGSGHHGHSGRPGKRGGSAPGGGSGGGPATDASEGAGSQGFVAADAKGDYKKVTEKDGVKYTTYLFHQSASDAKAMALGGEAEKVGFYDAVSTASGFKDRRGGELFTATPANLKKALTFASQQHDDYIKTAKQPKVAGRRKPKLPLYD